MTIGSGGMRSSRGGNSPASTSAASIGASWKLAMRLPVACSYSLTVAKKFTISGTRPSISAIGPAAAAVSASAAAVVSSVPPASASHGISASPTATASNRLSIICASLLW